MRTPAIVIALLLAAAGIGGVRAAPEMVSGPEISLLVRTTIVALHQANATGNYSVLRDLGDRRFQLGYTPTALAEMFRRLREQQVSLAPVVLFDAQLDMPPRLTTDGLMRLAGHFPTTPQQVVFDMVFRYEENTWRIDALNVGLRPDPGAPPAAADASSAKPSAAKPDRPPIPLARPASRASPRAAPPPETRSPAGS